jgi:glycine cleavage system H protein
VIEINAPLIEAPEQLADDPYGEGWLLKVRVNDPGDVDDALSADEYRQQVEGE